MIPAGGGGGHKADGLVGGGGDGVGGGGDGVWGGGEGGGGERTGWQGLSQDAHILQSTPIGGDDEYGTSSLIVAWEEAVWKGKRNARRRKTRSMAMRERERE